MPDKIKILFVITKANFGGAQRYVYDLATSLPTDQYIATVLAGEGVGLKDRLEKIGVPFYRLNSLSRDVGLRNDWRVFWQLIKVFKKEKPAIVHLNSSKIGLLGALAGRAAGVPKIIFTAHNWAFNEDRPFWQRVAIKFLHWLTVLACHTTITVSEKTRSQLASWPGVADKFVVIHNGIRPIDLLSRNDAREALAKTIWKTGFDISALDQALIIGTISELHKNKGVDILLNAISELKNKLDDVLIWIIGGGEEAERLKEQVVNLKLKDRVVFLGPVPEAAHYIRAFDIFTLTSRTEAFPYALLEAGQAGLPVIASSVGGIPEIISEFNQGIMVRPGNLKELKLALLRLIDNPAERQKFGDNLAKKVNRDFTAEKMVRETVKLYGNKQ